MAKADMKIKIHLERAFFECDFEIDQLVEYKQDRNDETTLFGFIREVLFFKSDAVNFSARYNIEPVNTDHGGEKMAPALDREIYEHNILRVYIPKN